MNFLVQFSSNEQDEYGSTESELILLRDQEGIDTLLINIHVSDHRVRGELYKVNTSELGPLDELEGIEIGHYERLLVTVAGDGSETVAAKAHFAHRRFGEGTWKRCGELGIEEFSMELGKIYERKEERPFNRDFRQDITNFAPSVSQRMV